MSEEELEASDSFEGLPPVSSLNVLTRDNPSTISYNNDEFGDTITRIQTPEGSDLLDLVACHYNARPEQGIAARYRSTIIHIRLFNNWVKSVLIREFVKGRNLKVLDVACGKGGDLKKFDRNSVTNLTGIDIAEVSIQHARERYQELKPRYDGRFVVFDAFRNAFPPGLLPLRLYDTVSCQFALHYSFESQVTARQAIKNIASSLTPGGYFFGTIPNHEEILALLKNSPDHQTISGKYFKIVFDHPMGELLEQKSNRTPYGHRYTFSLIDAVDGCPEYIIPLPVLIYLCEQEDLDHLMSMSFPEFYNHFSQMGEYDSLLKRMGVVDATSGELQLDDDERAVANLYSVFVFRKKRSQHYGNQHQGGRSYNQNQVHHPR